MKKFIKYIFKYFEKKPIPIKENLSEPLVEAIKREGNEIQNITKAISEYKEYEEKFVDNDNLKQRASFFLTAGGSIQGRNEKVSEFRQNEKNVPVDMLEPMLKVETKSKKTKLRLNSLYSRSHGIGVQGSDPVTAIDSATLFYSGAYARHLYRSLDGVQRIVDMFAEDALREGWRIRLKYKDKTEKELAPIVVALEERLKELDMSKTLRDSIKFSNLFSRGVGVFPIIDGMSSDEIDLSKPIDYEAIRRIKKINTVLDDRISYYINIINPLSDSYGEIAWFLLGSTFVHPSRIQLVINDLDIYYQRGVSVLDRIATSLKGISIAQWSTSVLLIKYSIFILQFDARASEGNYSKEDIRNMLEGISKQWSSKSAIAIPNIFTPEHLNVNFSGIGEAYNYLFTYLAFVLGMSESQLRGSMMGGTSGADRDRYAYSDLIKAREIEPKAKPLLEKICKMLIYESETKMKDVMKNFDKSEMQITAEFNPLIVETEADQESSKSIKTKTIGEQLAMGILTKPEARKALMPDLPSFDSVKEEIETEQEEQAKKEQERQQAGQEQERTPEQRKLQEKSRAGFVKKKDERKFDDVDKKVQRSK